MIRTTPKCSCTTRDGTQCGRKVTDGSQPPMCHIHLAQKNGTSPSPIIPVGKFDPDAKLVKIAANDRHPQQLPAIIQLRKDRAECARCQRSQTKERRNNHALSLATPEQRAELRRHVTGIQNLIATILQEPIHADTIDERPKSSRTPAEAPDPAAERAAAHAAPPAAATVAAWHGDRLVEEPREARAWERVA